MENTENDSQKGITQERMFGDNVGKEESLSPSLTIRVPVGTLYYKSLYDIVGQDPESKWINKKYRNFHHAETDQNISRPLAELDPHDPEDKNKVKIEGKGWYVKVLVGNDAFWVPYNSHRPRKREKTRRT